MKDINNIINGIVIVALELIKNTDMKNLMDLSEASANYDVDNKYAVFINFEPYDCPNHGVWFTFYEKNNGDGWNIEEQDTSDLTEESIRYNLKLLFDFNSVKERLIESNK